jgi:hypothetical protein
MGFDPYNRSLKIRESTRIPTPKMGAHLGVCDCQLSHSPTLMASLLACALASPCLGREPKARVATTHILHE